MSNESIDLESLLKTGEFQRDCDSLKESLRGVESAARQAFGSMSASVREETQKIRADLEAFRDNIQQTADGIAGLEKQQAEASGAKRARLSAELEAGRQALAGKQALYTEMQNKAETAADANLRLSARLEELRDSMSRLQLAGETQSATYQAIQEEAVNTGKALEDTSQRLASLGQQSGLLKGFTEGLSGLSGAADAARGMMALFGQENEEVIRVLSRLQAIEGITVGVNQAAAALYKESAFRVQVVARAKQAWAAATVYLNTQLGMSVGLSKALMTGGIGLLIAGVGILAAKLITMGKESDTAGESIRNAMDNAATAYGRSKVELDNYVAILHDEHAALTEKVKAQKFLEENVPGYFAVLDKEGRLVRENTDALEKYNATLIQRAMLSSLDDEKKKAMADLGIKGLERKKAEDRLNSFPKDAPLKQQTTSNKRGIMISTTPKGYAKEDYDKANSTYLAAQEVYDKLQATQTSIMEEIRENYKEIPVGDQIAGLEKQRQKLESVYQDAGMPGKTEEETRQEQAQISLQKGLIDKRLEFLKLKNKPENENPGKATPETTGQDINEAILSNQLKLEQERLAIMRDGRVKRLQESELEHAQREEAIKKEQAGLLEKYAQERKSNPARTNEPDRSREIKAGFSKRLETNDEAKASRDQGIEANHDQEVAARAKALTETLLTEEERRTQAIRERYDKEREWAKQNISNPEKQNDYLAKVDQAQEHDETFDLLEKYKTYAQKRLEIEEQFEASRKRLNQGGADQESIALLEADKQEALEQLDSTVASKDEQFQGMLDNITRMSLKKLKEALAEADNALKASEAAGGANSAQAAVERAKINVLREEISAQEAQGKAGNTDQWKDTLEIMERTRNTVDSMISSFDGLDDTTKAALSAASNVAGGTIAMITGIQALAATGAQAIKGVQRASVILTIIAAAVQVAMALFNLFNGDKKKEKKIQDLQREVDNLSHAYEKLGRTMDNTYSERVYGLMDNQQENLRAQQELLRQQIAEEQGKKKTDQGKIDEWNRQIEDINATIAENERKRIETLAGTDVKSAISSFSDALVEAYAAGGDKGSQILADTTKKMMANAVKGALEKKFLGDAVQKAVNYLGTSMEDSILSDSEQANFEGMMNSAGQRFTEAMKAYDNLFKSQMEAEEDPDSARGQIQGQLTEQTGSEFLGLTRVHLDVARQTKDINAAMLAISQNDTQCLADQLRQQLLIQENTRRTADNTDGLRDKLDEIKVSLKNIETKGGGLYGR